MMVAAMATPNATPEVTGFERGESRKEEDALRDDEDGGDDSCR